MSTSTDAILWWGVAIPDEDYDATERVSEIVNGDPDDEDSNLYGDGREWLTEHGLMGKVEFVDHCSMSSPMWGVALAGTVTRARRGYPHSVGRSLEPAHDPDGNVHAAVEALGLDLPHDAYGWHLASFWEV